jgi:type VI secretion system secreted protein Hcp
VKQVNPDTIVPATSTEPAMEEVTFVFHTISWTITDGGVSHQDTWSQNK